MTHAFSLSRPAFEGMPLAEPSDADTVDSLRSIEGAVRRDLARLGYSVVCGAALKRRDGVQSLEPLFGDTAHPGLRRYLSLGWDAQCPVLALTTPQPMFWSEALAELAPPFRAAILQELGAWGLCDGHIVVVDRLDGGPVVVAAAGAAIDAQDPAVRAASHFLSVYYGLIGLRLWRRNPLASPSAALTERQLECLKWVRDGKSSSDIGQIIGLSARTVDEHLALAGVRLGVRTRVQAVAEAARRGLLDL